MRGQKPAAQQDEQHAEAPQHQAPTGWRKKPIHPMEPRLSAAASYLWGRSTFLQHQRRSSGRCGPEESPPSYEWAVVAVWPCESQITMATPMTKAARKTALAQSGGNERLTIASEPAIAEANCMMKTARCGESPLATKR